MQPPTLRALVVSLAPTLAIAACGDDGGGGSDTAATDAATTDSATTDSATTDTTTSDDTTTIDASSETTDTAQASETADGSEVSSGEAELLIIDKQPPVDLTPDGATLLIWDSASLGDAYLYEVATRTLALETTVGGSPRDFPTAISANKRITANYGEPIQAGLWTGESWRSLGSLFDEGCGVSDEDPKAGDIGSAWDVSEDGEIVVGLLWEGCTTAAFRWSDNGDGSRDFRLLDRLGGVPEGASLGPVNRATVISDDGLVAAGFAQTPLVDRWPAYWSTVTGNGSLLQTAAFPNDAPGEVLAIEADGSVLVGVWNQHPFRWDASDGVVDLGVLPGSEASDPGFANAVAANGTLVFGVSGGGFFSTPNAFVWTKDQGMRKLADVAAANGITLPAESSLTNVLAASSDGAVVAGTISDATFNTKTFVLRLPPSAYLAAD